MRVVFSDRATLGRMLAVESALAKAEATAGVIPRGAAVPIAAACNPARFEVEEIAEAGPAGGVKTLTAAVAKRDAEAALRPLGCHEPGHHRHGDSAPRSRCDRIAAPRSRSCHQEPRRAGPPSPQETDGWPHLAPAGAADHFQAEGRALGRDARARAHLDEAAAAASVLQFGGAAGTLASLGAKGPAMAKRLADELQLGLPDAPWHGERDRIAAVAVSLGIAIGTAGKIARDISLLMQTEVAEVFEPAAPGRGGSSTMPHKRNPVACAQILTASTLAPGLVAGVLSAMVQEHERALGGWQAEWIALPELFLLASGALARLAETAKGLEVDTQRMRANLEITNGLVMAEAVQMALGEKLVASPRVTCLSCEQARGIREAPLEGCACGNSRSYGNAYPGTLEFTFRPRGLSR